MLDRTGQERDFERLKRVVCHVPVRHLHRPHGLEQLPQIAEAILTDSQSLA
jgi:hypothetical protein